MRRRSLRVFGLAWTRRCSIAGAALLLPSLGAQPPLALVPVDTAKDGGVKVAGAIEVSNGHAIISSSGTITAGDRTANIFLPGRGELRLCSTTTVHLSRDRSVIPTAIPAPTAAIPAGTALSPGAPLSNTASTNPTGPGALMMALDRGALEASFTTGKYSDVLMTPDFRILISGPGQADLRIRVSPQGDTCVENRGDHAPYVTVSSQLEEGLYRVQAGQRVLFEHGSLREVVDHEAEPCGCPPSPVLTANDRAGAPGETAAKTPPFPLAESEGLAPVPATTEPPSVPGQTYTQVTVPLVYNGTAGNGTAGNGTAGNGAATDGAAMTPPPPPPVPQQQSLTVSAPPPPQPPPPSKGIFHRLGKFFSHLFGK